MARSALQDPLDKFRWKVSIDGFTRLGFTSSSTPSTTIQDRKYSEGGAHLNPKSIVDSVSYNPVTLSRGVTNDTSFNKWANGLFDLVQNNAATSSSNPIGNLVTPGADPVASNDSYPFQYRRNVRLEHVNRVGQTEVVYTLYNAYPIEYKPASDFNSEDDDSLSIETIVLAYEGFDVNYVGLTGTAVNLITGALI